MRELLVPWGI